MKLLLAALIVALSASAAEAGWGRQVNPRSNSCPNYGHYNPYYGPRYYAPPTRRYYGPPTPRYQAPQAPNHLHVQPRRSPYSWYFSW